MINAEKYRDEILAKVDKTERFAIKTDNKNVLRNCIDLECSECLFNEGTGLCYFERMKWLVSEYKKHIKLTRFEYEILEHLFKNKQYRFIVRERNGYLYAYINKPRKYDKAWQALTCMRSMSLFDDLFQFIQWENEEPTLIEEVLKNCEVVDYD